MSDTIVRVTASAPTVIVRPGTIPVAQEQLGYSLVRPLSEWATVANADAGVAVEEHATGLTLTIAPGDANTDAPETAWHATGLLSDALAGTVAGREHEEAGQWWRAALRMLLMRRGALTGSDIWCSMLLSGEPFATFAPESVVGIGLQLNGALQQVKLHNRANEVWSQAVADTAEARGVFYDVPVGSYRISSGGRMVGRIGGPVAVGESGAILPVDFGVGRPEFINWAPDATIYLTIAAGRMAVGGQGTISVAPQIFCGAPRLAVPGA